MNVFKKSQRVMHAKQQKPRRYGAFQVVDHMNVIRNLRYIFSRDASKVRQVLRIYRQLDGDVSQFKKATGLSCAKGCGKCCESPKVDATILEVLPLALWLHRRGESKAWQEKIEDVNRGGICVFYKPDPFVPGNGRCSVYRFRPLVCRLFGFSAVKNKYDKPVLSTCITIKSTQSLACAQAQEHMDKGLAVPQGMNYSYQILAIDPQAGTSRLRINDAVKQALERLDNSSIASK